MTKKKINWDTIDNQMKELKFPLSFIFNIIKCQDKIEDYELSLIFRFFFKNQLNISLNYPLFVILKFLKPKFKISHNIVNDFYSSYLKKHIFLNILIKFKNNYPNKEFWLKKFKDQRKILENSCLIFKAHFNSSYTEFLGFSKFVTQLKLKNDNINNIIKNSLYDSIKIMGIDFFTKNNIRLILEKEYDQLEIKDKIKYITYYYMKVVKTLNFIINIYDILNSYDIKLKEIINPKPIYINFDTIYSDNNTEDIDFMIN